jgi:thioredoxin reductase (NADPH)
MLPSCDLAIAGGGPAGLAAAISAASEGLNVRLIDPDTFGGQARWSTAIENVPGFPDGITGQEYANRSLKQARKFGVATLLDRVDTFCPLRDGTIAVQLASARLLECRALILATGLAPRTFPDTASVFGVLPHAHPDDLPRYAGKSVAIIGAGNSAGQAALALASAGASVSLFSRRPVTATMSRYLIDRLSAITVATETITSIVRSNGSLLVNGRSFDAVFPFIGSRPSHLFPVDCDPDRYVLAPHYATSIPGVFAIGDLRATSPKRIAAAVGDGSAVVPTIHNYLTKGH